MQLIGGASKPSVNTATLTTTWTSPCSKSCNISLRCSLGVSPVTISALMAFFLNSSQTSCAWVIVLQKTTVFLSPDLSCHSWTIFSLMARLFIIFSTSDISKSITVLRTFCKSFCTPTSTTYVLGGTKKPSLINVLISIWCEQLVNTFLRPFLSPRLGVAVKPTISTDSFACLTLSMIRIYVSATAWWLSSTTTKSKWLMLFRLFSLDSVCTMLNIVLPDQSFSDPSTMLVVMLGLTLENLVLFCLTNSSLCCRIRTLLPTLYLLPTRADNIIVLPAPVGATTIVFLCLSSAVEASSTATSWYGLKIMFVS